MINPLICVLGITFSLAVSSSKEEATFQHTFYVSPLGSDQNPGTKTAPFKSIGFAQQAVRKVLQESQAKTIAVYLRQGIYRLDQTLVFNTLDSAPDGGRVTSHWQYLRTLREVRRLMRKQHIRCWVWSPLATKHMMAVNS